MVPWRSWLSRLSLSLLALAFVFAWQAWRLQQAGGAQWKIVGYYLLAAGLAAAGFAGLRERHRR